MRIPEEGPFGETFFEASERAIAVALLVNRSFGGCVESVLTFFTQRFCAGVFFLAGLDADARRAGVFFEGAFLCAALDRMGTAQCFLKYWTSRSC